MKIPGNFWHWLSGLMAAPVLFWILRDAPMPAEHTGFVKTVYCGLAVAVPVIANWFNELRDEFKFWPWLPWNWDNRGFDIFDILRCIPLALVSCFVWLLWDKLVKFCVNFF